MSNNNKQAPFWNTLLIQTKVYSLCNKQYNYSCILNIKNESPVAKQWWQFTHVLMNIENYCIVIYFRYSEYRSSYNIIISDMQ
jgi:hypothetical protein